ncbi:MULTISPECIES: hypothetical protein [Bacillus]|uniref:hypothetical protein n=1 Tax=Bacillus TaxID=1386 RepID=UPI001144B14D|nr:MULTISPECIES: hypothetical protein [Bacillus]
MMTNKKITTVGYVLYAFMTFFVLWLAVKLQRDVSLYSISNFSYYPYIVFTVICSYVLGMYFSIPHLLKEVLWKEGEWCFNRMKFLSWSLPLLLLSILPLITFRNSNALELVLTQSKMLIYYEMNGLLIGILAIYTFFTCINRRLC